MATTLSTWTFVLLRILNDFMRHSSTTTVPYPVNCDRRRGNSPWQSLIQDSGVSPNIQICHACLQVFYNLKHLQWTAGPQRDNRQSKIMLVARDIMQSTSMNTTVSSLNNNNDTSTQQKYPMKSSSFTKILSMNCNSIKGNTKNCEFLALLQQYDPRVILGLSPKFTTFSIYSLFLSHYTEVHRKDHTKYGGSVLCNQATEEKDLSKDKECV